MRLFLAVRSERGIEFRKQLYDDTIMCQSLALNPLLQHTQVSCGLPATSGRLIFYPTDYLSIGESHIQFPPSVSSRSTLKCIHDPKMWD